MARSDTQPLAQSDAAAADVSATSYEAWGIVSRLIAGMILYGALGALVGSWFDRLPIGLGVGVLVGIGLGLYVSLLRIDRLDRPDAAAVSVSASQSWSARFTRARMAAAGAPGAGTVGTHSAAASVAPGQGDQR